MSRRRSPRPEQVGQAERQVHLEQFRRQFGSRSRHEIVVNCTDGGQHSRARLTSFHLIASEHGTSWRVEPTDKVELPSWMSPGEVSLQTSQWSYRFWCGKCPRSPKVDAEHLHAALDALRSAEATSLDISAKVGPFST